MSFARASPFWLLRVFARESNHRGTPRYTMKPPVVLTNACLMSTVGSSALSGKLISNPLGITTRSRLN